MQSVTSGAVNNKLNSYIPSGYDDTPGDDAVEWAKNKCNYWKRQHITPNGIIDGGGWAGVDYNSAIYVQSQSAEPSGFENRAFLIAYDNISKQIIFTNGTESATIQLQ